MALNVMTVHSISRDNAELSGLIDKVQSGGEVVLVNKAGDPVAVLVAYNRAYPFAAGINEVISRSLPGYETATPARKPGSMAGQIWIAPDFDVLPDDVAEAFGVPEPPR